MIEKKVRKVGSFFINEELIFLEPFRGENALMELTLTEIQQLYGEITQNADLTQMQDVSPS